MGHFVPVIPIFFSLRRRKEHHIANRLAFTASCVDYLRCSITALFRLAAEAVVVGGGKSSLGINMREY
jgi:hypothetical protein